VLAIAQPLHRLLDAFVARALALGITHPLDVVLLGATILRLAKSDAFSR
jgi:hypothetical protein